jgi:hypothetical protein
MACQNLGYSKREEFATFEYYGFLTNPFLNACLQHADNLKRLLRFKIAGGERTLTEHLNTPAQLLWIDLRLLNISIDRRAGKRPAGADRRALAA